MGTPFPVLRQVYLIVDDGKIGSLGTAMSTAAWLLAAVAGPAVAGGMERALWCDVRGMQNDAYFGVYCCRWGVPLIDGDTVRLTRIVSQGRALEKISHPRVAHAFLVAGIFVAAMDGIR